MLFKKLLTSIDGSRYIICNRCNDNQPTLTPVFNPRSISMELYYDDNRSIDDYLSVPNSFTSMIKMDCKYIFKCLPTPASPA